MLAHFRQHCVVTDRLERMRATPETRDCFGISVISGWYCFLFGPYDIQDLARC